MKIYPRLTSAKNYADELSLLKDFFDQTFKPGDTRCDSFTKAFMQPDGRLTDSSLFTNSVLIAGQSPQGTATPARFQDSRLQSLWNEVPNKINNAFIGLEVIVNGVKGCIFNPNCQGIQSVQQGTDDVSIKQKLEPLE